jgi:transcription antitermination factor NusG
MNHPNQTNERNQTNQTNHLHWYALRTRSRHEKLVRDRLALLGIEQLLPTVKRMNQWKDRKKEVEVPLFSCYCFARFPWQDRMAVLTLSGVVEIVGGGQRAEPVSEEEIHSLKTLMAGPLRYDSHPYLREGMVVEVIRGPLAGATGLLVRKEKRYRLVIQIHLIRQAASVEINASDVAPI